MVKRLVQMFLNVILTFHADIDIISTSSIHQGVAHVDFSLKIDH
jgi:nicotinate-nucleotide pyrophosphorylase